MSNTVAMEVSLRRGFCNCHKGFCVALCYTGATDQVERSGAVAEEQKPDDSEPSPERQAELRAAYEANMAAGKAPYEGVEIRTLGELLWVIRERRWSSKTALPEGYERV